MSLKFKDLAYCYKEIENINSMIILSGEFLKSQVYCELNNNCAYKVVANLMSYLEKTSQKCHYNG